MKYISFPLMGFLLLADYTSADSYKKYIPDSVKQYIPEFINEEESMQDSFGVIIGTMRYLLHR